METLYKVGDRVRITTLMIERNNHPTSPDDSPTFGSIGIWSDLTRIGTIVEIIDIKAPEHVNIWNTRMAQARGITYAYCVRLEATPGLEAYPLTYKFSEDEIEIDAAYMARFRAETEMAEILEHQWIEDVL